MKESKIEKKLAIMQPYFFPYIGYFQLIDQVDQFLFYDDVNFRKGGWIHRNRISAKSTNHQVTYFSLQLNKASSYTKIHDIGLNKNPQWRKKRLKTLHLAYCRSPNFEEVYALAESVLQSPSNNLSEIAIQSVTSVCSYLGINTEFVMSSRNIGNEHLSGLVRVIDTCQRLRAKQYCNLIGGRGLYKQEDFAKQGIKLRFIKTDLFPYSEWNLSILHLMFLLPKKELSQMIQDYTLVEE